MWFGLKILKENSWKGYGSQCLGEWLLCWMQRDGIQSIDFFCFVISYMVFLYLMDDYLNFQFILSSCGCIGSKFKVVVGLPLPGRTNPFVPVL